MQPHKGAKHVDLRNQIEQRACSSTTITREKPFYSERVKGVKIHFADAHRGDCQFRHAYEKKSEATKSKANLKQLWLPNGLL